MDIADISDARAEVESEIRRKYFTVAPEATATGNCLNCGEPVGDDMRWCDCNCREDWEVHCKK